MSFVSARELEAARQVRKEQKKEMREDILRQAKENFEKDRKREELKRARGEDTWILPAVKKRLALKGEAASLSSEKKKKKKKKKNKERKKHNKKASSESESQGSEGEEEEEEGTWVELGSDGPKLPSTSSVNESGNQAEKAAESAAPLHREEWMTMALGPSDSALSIMTERRRDREAERREKEEEKMEVRRNLLCFIVDVAITCLPPTTIYYNTCLYTCTCTSVLLFFVVYTYA